MHVCEQYHYPHFVDRGTPTDYYSMIGLISKLRENPTERTLVHCRLRTNTVTLTFFLLFEWISSAGVGRTGVFIALYYLFDQFERRQRLNVRQTVDTIRLYRPHLVQTLVKETFMNSIVSRF